VNVQSLPTNKQLSQSVKTAALDQGVAERRFRRWIAVISLLEIFNIAKSRKEIPSYLVKGGAAIEFRFRSQARSSRDLDIVLEVDRARLVDSAILAMRTSWSGFSFRIKGAVEEREHSIRFEVNASYLGREWSTFEVELVDGSATEYEAVEVYDMVEFGLLTPTAVPCLSVFEQIAQKLHAVSDPDENRPRDLIDIFLLDSHTQRDDMTLRTVATAEFGRRAKHSWPPLISLREGWSETLTELIQRSGLDLKVDDIVDGVNSLVLRLIGIISKMNHRYHFLVLSGQMTVPNIVQAAISVDEAYNVFKRMTEEEGWRLVHAMPYPNGQPNRAILAILEKAVEPSTT
jgi:hypothetical protein